MIIRSLLICSVTLLFATGCTSPENLSTDDVLLEAQNFYKEYATDLEEKKLESLASRYHRTGAFFLGNGHKMFRSHDEIKTVYLEKWGGPEKFEFQDLSYEVLGPDAVNVLGTFAWTTKSDKVMNYSYVGLLQREDGELRIRFEDESMNPMDVKEILCADDPPSAP